MTKVYEHMCVCYRCRGPCRRAKERRWFGHLSSCMSLWRSWGRERVGERGAWVRGLPFNADYRPIRGSQTVKDCRGEGGGQLRGRPRRSIISSKETPSANIQISFAQLRPDYTHLSMRRATPRRQLTSCLNDMRICNDSSCSLETRTDQPTR